MKKSNTNTCKNCVCGYLYNDPNDSQDYVMCMLNDDVHTPEYSCANHHICTYPHDCDLCPAIGSLCQTDTIK